MLTKTLLTHTAKLNIVFKLTLPIPTCLMASHRCRLHGDARGHFEAERVETPFPLLKSCRNAWERRSHC